jgi:hypothetical protein
MVSIYAHDSHHAEIADKVETPEQISNDEYCCRTEGQKLIIRDAVNPSPLFIPIATEQYVDDAVDAIELQSLKMEKYEGSAGIAKIMHGFQPRNCRSMTVLFWNLALYLSFKHQW